MQSSLTPDECIAYLQEFKGTPPDFIEKNGAWLLTVIGLVGGAGSALLLYFLKSRCKTIDCGCIHCVREPLKSSVVSDTFNAAENA